MANARKRRVVVTHLTPRAVQKLVRPRPRFETYAPKLMALYRAQSKELYIPGFDPDAVLDDVETHGVLTERETALVSELKRVRETKLLYASRIYSAELAVYHRGQAAARTNADIGDGIADFAALLKKRKKRR